MEACEVRRTTIGVLGGAGPAAAALLHRHIVTEAQLRGAVADSDYPDVVIVGAAVPGASHLGFGADDEVTDSLVDGVNRLAAAGADFAVIACVTLHRLLDAVRDRTTIDVLDLVEATVDATCRTGLARVGVLCSAESRREGVFTAAFKQRGIDATYVEDQALVDELIIGAMAGHAQPIGLAAAAAGLAEVDAVVLGCTELSIHNTIGGTAVDCLEVAARICVDRAFEASL